MKKLDNRGLSLIELVVAIAMATIVIGAATTFLYSAERSYRTAEYSIDLQMEAQLMMEQMGNWIMESNYVTFDGAAGSNYLVLYKIPRSAVDPSTLDPVAQTGERKIIYIHGKKLYIKIDSETAPGVYVDEIKNNTLDTSFLSATPSEEYCIGEYTQFFTVTLPDGVSPDKITSINVEVGMHEGVSSQSQSYSVSNRFSVRNGIYDIETD